MDGINMKDIKQCIGGRYKWFQKKRILYITLELHNKRKSIEVPITSIPNGPELYQKFLPGDMTTDESEREEVAEEMTMMMELLHIPPGVSSSTNSPETPCIPNKVNVSVDLVKLTDAEIAKYTKRARPVEVLAAAAAPAKKRRRLNEDDFPGLFCQSCDHVFQTKYRLEKHLMSRKHNNIRVPCHFCKKLKSYNNVAAHEALCVDGKPELEAILKARQRQGNTSRIRKAAAAAASASAQQKKKKNLRSKLAQRKRNFDPMSIFDHQDEEETDSV